MKLMICPSWIPSLTLFKRGDVSSNWTLIFFPLALMDCNLRVGKFDVDYFLRQHFIKLRLMDSGNG